MAGIIFSKGSGLNDSIYGKSQEPIRAVIEKNVEAFEQQSQIKNVFFMDSTRNYAEKYTQETSLGNFEDVGENGAYPKTSMQEGYAKVVEPTTWKSSFEVTQEMVEDAKYGKIKSRANIFATSFNRTREEFAAGLLAGGIALAAAALLFWRYAVLVLRAFGGVTGDLLGFLVELSQLVLLLALALAAAFCL